MSQANNRRRDRRRENKPNVAENRLEIGEKSIEAGELLENDCCNGEKKWLGVSNSENRHTIFRIQLGFVVRFCCGDFGVWEKENRYAENEGWYHGDYGNCPVVEPDAHEVD